MLCQNCGKNEVNVKYTKIINGVKEQMSLCDKCAKELEIEDIKFNMPISFSSFLADAFDMYENTIPTLIKSGTLTCNKCNTTYDEFLKTGKFGCSNCYEIFKIKLDSILKNIHGSNRHIGRVEKFVKENKINTKLDVKQEGFKVNDNINIKEEIYNKEINEQRSKLEDLKERLKQEIKEERYEDAAKTRDEIRNCQKGRGILTILCQKRASLMTKKEENMNWYLDSGKESDVIVSSRIRLARNLNNLPFKTRMSKEDINKLLEKVKFITPSLGYGLKYLKMKDMDDITKLSLVEKHIISPDIISDKNEENSSILINDEENICIMINEEDHIRIQIFNTGLDLQNTMNLAREIEVKLDKVLHFATKEEYGYLTTCPTNVGTGLRASVMVHLPALKLTGNISKILHIVNSFGMTIRGIYGEESQSKGDMYQISNNQTLGITEDEIINNLENITKKVMEQERLARNYLTKNRIDLEDRVYRSYGVLTNAVKITSDECISLLSDVKLGTDLGIISQLNDSKIKQLELYTKPANLQKYVGKLLNTYDRDIKRGEVIKEIIVKRDGGY